MNWNAFGTIIIPILFILYILFIIRFLIVLSKTKDVELKAKDPEALEMTYALKWAEYSIYWVRIAFWGLLIPVLLGVIAFVIWYKKFSSLDYSIMVHILYFLLIILSSVFGYFHGFLRYCDVTHRTSKIAEREMNIWKSTFLRRDYYYTYTNIFYSLAIILLLIAPILFIVLASYIYAIIFFFLPIFMLHLIDIVFWEKYFYMKIINKPDFKMYID